MTLCALAGRLPMRSSLGRSRFPSPAAGKVRAFSGRRYSFLAGVRGYSSITIASSGRRSLFHEDLGLNVSLRTAPAGSSALHKERFPLLVDIQWLEWLECCCVREAVR